MHDLSAKQCRRGAPTVDRNQSEAIAAVRVVRWFPREGVSYRAYLYGAPSGLVLFNENTNALLPGFGVTETAL